VTVRELKTRDDTARFIVVEGPIGVGKTSLATRLADSLSGELVLEHLTENPFLERFYRSGRTAALPAQLFYLFQRTRQLEELRQADMFAPVRVADYLIDKDRIFAELTLDGEELALYNQICEKLDVDAPIPDLVIYLQASVDTLLARIARRGIGYERMIDRAYLEQLNDAYARHFYSYDDAPLLIVNASGIDLVHNQSDYEQLFQQIQKTTGGRHFFNPSAVALA
jgi:deoxyadenosine/deoxycytidine kinase